MGEVAFVCCMRLHCASANAILMQAVDLTGEREFLTSETAETALAAMLAPGSTISQVLGSDRRKPC